MKKQRLAVVERLNFGGNDVNEDTLTFDIDDKITKLECDEEGEFEEFQHQGETLRGIEK